MATQDSMVAGVFSTPEQYQQQQRQALYEQAVQESKLDPYQQARVNLQTGVQGLAQAGAGMLGAQDPQMQLQSQRRALLAEINPNDPNSLAQAAQKAAQMGDRALLSDIMGQLKSVSDIRKEQATTEKTAQDIVKSKQDVLGVQSRAQTLLDEGVPEAKAKALASSEKAFSEYISSKKIATPADYAVAAGAAGLPVKAFLSDYTPEEIRKMEQGVFAHKSGIAQAGRTTIINQQEGELTKSNVNAFGMLRDQAVAAGKTLEAVKNITPLIDKAFTGFASNQKLTAGQLADTFGIPIEGTSETEQLKSLQNNLKIGNSTVLKGSLSDKDMAILGEAIGQGNTTAAGIRAIINNIKKDALIAQSQYQKANEYQQQGKLSQYDFVKGSNEARDEITKDLDAKMKRLKELEAKAGGTK
jgi:hypothetical protein